MYEWHTDHTNFNSNWAISAYEYGMGDRYATYYYGSNDDSTELLQSLVWETQQMRYTRNSKVGPPTIVEK